MSSQPARIRDFPSNPASAGAARRFMLEASLAWSLDATHVDALLLVVSELATNAILHAMTPFRVTLRHLNRDVRIEVADGSGAMPVVRHYADDATTGRGLALVMASSRQWGVTTNSDGKIIWAEVPPPTVTTADRPLQIAGHRHRARQRADARPVQFLAVPVEGYLALQAHNDEIFRDLELLRIEADVLDGTTTSVPAAVLEVIAPLTTAFGRPRDNLREDIERAYKAGLTAVDLVHDFPASAVGSALEYVALLERVDDLCREGEILSAPAPPAVARLRRWFAEELDRQLLRGEPPTPAPT